ncbi:hypothetical protein Gohar_025078, partial [Gossypium harknessii]|nr:hypothetical protein [Gossypium harknessii]
SINDCITSREVLSIQGWDTSTTSRQYDCCIDWLEDMMRVLDKKAMANLMTILWNSWNNRNNFIFRGKEEEATVIWERASTLNKDFRICNLLKEPLLSPNIAVKKWEKPVVGGFIETRVSVHEAECMAFEKSIQLAGQLNIKGNVIFETDHASLVNKLRNN